MSLDTEPRSRPWVLAKTSYTGCMLAWFKFVGVVSRVNVATLLSKPGTAPVMGAAMAPIGVFLISFKELARYCGVCTAR